MRPSEISRSSARRASSRRIGLWHEMTTASGVSSMIRSTPVAASIARMLRPSRPMMRPFMSSLGQRDHRHGALGDELAGEPLDGDRHDLLRPAIGLLARLGLDLTNVPRRVVSRLLDHLLQQGALRLVARHSRSLLESLAHRLDEAVVFAPPVHELPLLPAELFLSALELRVALSERLEPPLDALLFLRDPLLHRCDLTALLPRFALRIGLRLGQEVPYLKLRLLANRVTFLARLLDDAGCRVLGSALEVLDASAPGHIDEPEETEPETQAKREEE